MISSPRPCHIRSPISAPAIASPECSSDIRLSSAMILASVPSAAAKSPAIASHGRARLSRTSCPYGRCSRSASAIAWAHDCHIWSTSPSSASTTVRMVAATT